MPKIELNGTTLFYEQKGSGEALLFIQGVGVAGGGWRPQTEYFCKDFRTICFDNRGLGQSAALTGKLTIEHMAEDARALLDFLKIPSAHVIGHSMGGVIAQQLAVSHPTRVKSLSLLCTFAQGKEAGKLNLPVLWIGIRTRVGTKRMRRLAMLQMILSKKEFAEANLDLLAEEYGELMGRDLAQSPAILLTQLRALIANDIYEKLKSIRVPTLVVSASEDIIAPPSFGRRLAAAIPGARFVEIENAGHAVPIEQPDKVNRLLTAIFQSPKR